MAITGRFDADFQPFLDAVQAANKSLESLDGQAKELNTSMDRVAAGQGWAGRIAEGDLLAESIKKAGEMVVSLGEHLAELTLKGAVVEDIETAFQHLATQAGLTADVLLNEMRAGVHGTIDDFDLMKRANENMAAGLALTEDQFRLMTDGAYALAKATGGDTKAALDAMSDAMVTGRTKGIALLTGKLDLKQAEADYAQSLIGTGRELTAEGKLEVDREAILARVGERLDALGVQHDNLDDKLKQAQAAWSNFENELGKVIAKSPILAAGLDTLRDSLINAFGGTQEAAIKNISAAIDAAAVIVVDFGIAAVETARVIHTGWAGVETVVLGVTAALGGAVSVVVEGWTVLAKAANAVSSNVVADDTVAKMTAVRDQVEGFTADVGRMTLEASKGVIGQSEFDKTLDKLGGTLFNTRDAMIAAQAAQAAHAAATEKGATATDHAATSNQTLADGLQPATQFTKQYVAAWEELNKTGDDYAATVAAMNPALVEQIEYYLKAGASVKTLAEAYPQASAAQITAIDVLQKRSESAALDIAKIWNEYTEVVGSGSETAYQKAQDAIDKWYADDIAKHQKSKTDTAEYYAAIAALDDAKYAKLAANRLADDTESKASLEKKAAADDEAYQFALAHQDQFSQEHIEKLRVDAEKSRLAAQGWGLGWEEAGKKAAAAVDKVDDSVKKVTLSTLQQMELQQKSSFSFAGGAQLDPKFASMSTDAKRAAGYIDAYGRVTPLGQEVGFGYSAMAAGGPVSAGTPYFVGEQGPELFVPTGAGTIVPNGRTGGVVINAPIYVNGTAADVARQVAAELLRTIKSGTQLAGA